MDKTKIPEGWSLTTLGEITEYINRGISPSYSNNGVLVINQKCIRSGNVSFDEARYTDSFIKKIPKEKYVQHEDILICSTGVGTLGRVGQIKYPDNHTTVDSHVSIVRTKSSTDKRFVGYLLKKSEKEIELMAEGSTGQTELQRSKLNNFPIFLPPLPEQKAIADVLSSFDDKIELLREEDKTLEAIAQTIFKEWFVNFNFPNEEGKPYKSTGGKMIDSELGEIPEGWRVSKLGEVDFLMFGDGNYSSKYPKQSDFLDVGIPFISNKDLRNGTIIREGLRYISIDQHKELIKGHLKKGDILISTRANIGDIALVPAMYENSNINAQLVFIRSNNPILYSIFLFILFKSYDYKRKFEGFSSGSAQSQLPINALKRVPIIISNEFILNKFSETTYDLFEKLELNLSQIQTLTILRDELLPKLMKGELRVNV